VGWQVSKLYNVLLCEKKKLGFEKNFFLVGCTEKGFSITRLLVIAHK